MEKKILSKEEFLKGIGETARVTATCNDPTSTLASGCTVSSFYHDYNYQINTQYSYQQVTLFLCQDA